MSDACEMERQRATMGVMGRVAKLKPDSIDHVAWQIIWEMAQESGITSKAELARRADIERTSLSRFIAGDATPSLDDTASAARAVGSRASAVVAAAEERLRSRQRQTVDIADLPYRPKP